MARITKTRLEDLKEACGQAETPFYVSAYSPGDGVTRYRFFSKPGNTYFGPGNGDFTALGWKEAAVYANGRGAFI
ncbi:hypothetical protein LCGC14_1977590 [marine sediment metagenome]|uniref:Uncharacterized protein n=1 Tax=marine sediment metagenome TaxID=412755 RepID=A0A0F9I6V6_9ZZZZ